MSELDRLVNSCLMPGFRGDPPPLWVEEAVRDGLAGVTFYGPNLTDADAVSRLGRSLRDLQPDVLVAIDEEGGDVTRLDYLSGSRYPGNLALGRVGDGDLTRQVASSIADDLLAASVNVNFAPSVDVNCNPENPVIGVRSFGNDAQEVAAQGAEFILGLQERGVVASAKHFPGHGDTHTDSHHDLPVIECDLNTFRSRELVPFLAAMEAGVKTIMTAHVVLRALDDQPATLSRRILTRLLRDELGYDGVIVTDALDMAGVRKVHGIAGAAVRALEAGADLLLLGSEDGERHCADIRHLVSERVADGELSLMRLEEAARRVQRLREWAAAGVQRVEAGRVTEQDVGLEAARRAVEASGALPLESPALVVELRPPANLAVGEAHWSLAEPMEALGVITGSLHVTADGPGPEEAVAKAAEGPLVVAVRDAYRHPWQREWLASLLAERPDTIVVAVGMPDDRVLAGETFVLTYGAGRVNTQAAAEVLMSRHG